MMGMKLFAHLDLSYRGPSSSYHDSAHEDLLETRLWTPSLSVVRGVWAAMDRLFELREL